MISAARSVSTYVDSEAIRLSISTPRLLEAVKSLFPTAPTSPSESDFEPMSLQEDDGKISQT